MEMNLPMNVKIVLEALHNNGHLAYVVGGCVRDFLLGKEPKDYDVATSALPEQIMDVFKGYEVIPTGLQHGTVTVVVGGTPIECTTFRVEIGYSDGRHPDNVLFALSVEDDLMRRDFRMNAIAYNPWHGLVDPYNGIKDLENKTIRCMGNPYDRFNEDGLRVLRALRFAAQLGFDIEEGTTKAIHDCKHLLDNISKERIQSELCKILMSNHCGCEVLEEYQDVINMFLSNTNIRHIQQVYMKKLGCMPTDKSDDIISRLAILFNHDSENTYVNLKELKFSNEIVAYVTQLVSYHMFDLPTNKSEMKSFMNKMSIEQIRRLIFIKKTKAMLPEDIDNVAKAENIFNEILENDECYNLKQLAINGNDLIEMGIPQGQLLGLFLDIILDKVIKGETENNKEALFDAVRLLKAEIVLGSD